MLDDSEDDVYQAKQPRMNRTVDRDGFVNALVVIVVAVALDCHSSACLSARGRAKSRGRSKLRFDLVRSEERHADVVGSDVWDEEEAEENWDTASRARDRTLDKAAFMVPSNVRSDSDPWVCSTLPEVRGAASASTNHGVETIMMVVVMATKGDGNVLVLMITVRITYCWECERVTVSESEPNHKKSVILAPSPSPLGCTCISCCIALQLIFPCCLSTLSSPLARSSFSSAIRQTHARNLSLSLFLFFLSCSARFSGHSDVVALLCE